MASKRDAQSSDSPRVAGVLDGPSSVTEPCDSLYGRTKFEFNTGRSAYPFQVTAESRITGVSDDQILYPGMQMSEDLMEGEED